MVGTLKFHFFISFIDTFRPTARSSHGAVIYKGADGVERMYDSFYILEFTFSFKGPWFWENHMMVA